MRVLVCLSCLWLSGCFPPQEPPPANPYDLAPMRLHVGRYVLEEVDR